MLQMIRKPRGKRRHIGPEDNGRRMSLDQFDRAIPREGYLYELNKGVIEVSGIPKPRHGLHVQRIRNQVGTYQEAHPDAIYFIGGGSEAKMLIGPAQSE